MRYLLDPNIPIHFPQKASHPVVTEFLSNYTYGEKWVTDHLRQDNVIATENAEAADLNDSEYVIHVTASGLYVQGTDYSALMRGYIALLERIRYCEKSSRFYIDTCLVYGKPTLHFRCVHLCVFPETKLDFLTKCLRTCAISSYTHAVVEFWGMLQLNCLKELSWSFAYTKDQIKQVFQEANALGIEIIPMFNHLAHAASARAINGKHVVLDQNPRLEYLFTSYGWVWDISREDVRVLHRQIRKELMELCGNGNYFHLGCDEAYAYGHGMENAKRLVSYLNTVSEELKAEGRRGIIWHDMLLEGSWKDGYASNSTKEVAEYLMANLAKDLIIADWEYFKRNEIWRSSTTFKRNGFDVLCCPWDNADVVAEAVQTAKELNCMGIIETTWQRLDQGFGKMVYAGKIAYDISLTDDSDIKLFYGAHAARKAMPSGGIYEKAGWTEKMVGPGL